MYLVLTASSDTYITNKIVDSTRRTTSNTGRAGTIDIFKLYDESSVITGAFELSRGLIGFDYERVRSLTGSSLNLNNFSAKLRMFGINSGHPVPSNFTLSLFPLSRSFDEGLGRDVISFIDIDDANFISASNVSEWYITGADSAGLLGSSNIDYISSGNFGDGLGERTFETKQDFILGTEDLSMDITSFVSASIVNLLPTNGFRLSFTGSQESDQITRFVKRFASRHVKNTMLRPRIEITWDDSRIDDRLYARFNLSGNLYINNTLRGSLSNLVSGSSLSEISGDNCLLLRLTTGSYTQYFTGSQEYLNSFTTGIYRSPFIIASSDNGIVSGSTTLSQHARTSGSIEFEEIWTSLDETVIFRSGSLVMRLEDPHVGLSGDEKLSVRTKGPVTSFAGNIVRVRVKFYDLSLEDRSVKFPIERKPVPVLGLYRVIDSISSQPYMDFHPIGTKLSLDENGNFFDFYSDCIPYGRSVRFEYKVNYRGREHIVKDDGYTFMLEV